MGKEKVTESEVEYLTWFRINADFGPAHGDVVHHMDEAYTRQTGSVVPKSWRSEDDGE